MVAFKSLSYWTLLQYLTILNSLSCFDIIEIIPNTTPISLIFLFWFLSLLISFFFFPHFLNVALSGVLLSIFSYNSAFFLWNLIYFCQLPLIMWIALISSPDLSPELETHIYNYFLYTHFSHQLLKLAYSNQKTSSFKTCFRSYILFPYSLNQPLSH